MKAVVVVLLIMMFLCAWVFYFMGMSGLTAFILISILVAVKIYDLIQKD